LPAVLQNKKTNLVGWAELAPMRWPQVTEALSGQVIDFSTEKRGLLRWF
jgi:hypothetical protein